MQGDGLHFEVDNSDEGALVGQKLALGVAPDQGGFADAHIADEDDLVATALLCAEFFIHCWIIFSRGF